MTLELSSQEASVLEQLLRRSLEDLQREIFHTTSSEYKAGLKESGRVMEKLLHEIRQEEAAQGHVHY